MATGLVLQVRLIDFRVHGDTAWSSRGRTRSFGGFPEIKAGNDGNDGNKSKNEVLDSVGTPFVATENLKKRTKLDSAGTEK